MPKSNVSPTAGVTVLFSRILVRPMVKINGKVQYLSSGTSMIEAAGKVIELFKDTWMRARGIGRLEEDGSRPIHKMGNIALLEDVEKNQDKFDLAVINTIRTVIPEFCTRIALNDFYKELMDLTGENEHMVRRGLSSSLGKITVEDLLLSGALSQDSPFFTRTAVGKAIRKKGIETYGTIEIRAELDADGHSVVVDYPKDLDLEFDHLKDAHLPNHVLSNVLSAANAESFSSTLWLKITSSTTEEKLGVLLLFAGLAMLTAGTCGLVGVIAALSLAASVGLTSAGGAMILGLGCLKHNGFFDSSTPEAADPEGLNIMQAQF